MSTFLFFISFIFAFQSSQESVNRFLLNSGGQNFDEYTFTGNINRGVTQIIQDQDGLFWIGTINGVFAFDGYEAIAYQDEITDTLSKYFKGIEISSLFQDREGNIWASSYTGNINVLVKGENQFRNLNKELNQYDFMPYSMVQDGDGYIWANSSQAILRMKYHSDSDSLEILHHQFETYKPINDDYHLFRLIITSEGKVNIAGDGLYSIEYSNEEGFSLNRVIEGTRFRDVHPINEDELLIADETQLILLNKDDLSRNNVWNTGSNRWINNIFIDKKGNLWISSGEGVYLLTGTKSEGYRTEKFFELGTVQDIYEDESGNLFFASSRGLIKLSWNFNHYSYIQFPPEFDQSYSFTYLMDPQGDYWIGAHDNLLRYDAISESVELVHSFGTNIIEEDLENNVWVGSKTGLFVFDHISNELVNQYPFENTWQIKIDEKGNIWGISMYRLFRIDAKTKEPTFFNDLIPIKEARYKRILISDNNILWLVDTDNILHQVSIKID
ncbi:MAG: ligand-binding sensor domain-containing protein, partial [Balneolaceae bacterium]